VGGQIVEKDWGYEEICVNEPTHCGKKLFIKLGRQCSLHHHDKKDETFHVLTGSVLMQVEDSVFWAAERTNIRIPPGTRHRFGAVDQSGTLVEFSSHHDDADVVRHEPSGPLTMWKTPSAHKVVTMEVAAREAMHVQGAGKRVVFTNGCFDIMHAGHVHVLEEARKHGDLLIVGLDSDASIRNLKGAGRPIQPEWGRAKLLAALAAVDLVVIFNGDKLKQLVEKICPNVIVKGDDYEEDQIVGADFVRLMGGDVIRVPRIDGSTGDVIASIRSGSA